MRELSLKKIAEEENAELKIQESKIPGEMGVYLTERSYLFTIKYKQKTINILMETGLSAIGQASCSICSPNEYMEFEMTTRNHIASLFFRKDRFKLVCKDPNIEVFFNQSIGMANLKEIAKNTAFEPTILGINFENSYQLILEYSLIFSDWHQVVKPIIILYKEFIDKFGEIKWHD